MPAVEVPRIAQVESVHGSWKYTGFDLHDQVVVRRHQTEGDASPPGLRGNSCELAQEVDSINVVTKVGLRRPNAMCEDVEGSSFKVARLMGHAVTIAATRNPVRQSFLTRA